MKQVAWLQYDKIKDILSLFGLFQDLSFVYSLTHEKLPVSIKSKLPLTELAFFCEQLLNHVSDTQE